MNYTQQNRAMEVKTPLGPDKLLLVGFTGQESISRLFNFHLDLIAENDTDVAFDKLLGQKITVRVDSVDGKKCHFNGLCNRISQGERDEIFTSYRMEIVPQLWLLTKRAQSRIFQQMSVPDILKKVLEGIDVAYEIQGTFHPRDFCVQYRETDFNFASRLMEEEGIFYFFKHSDGGHKMVVANTPQSHTDLPLNNKIVYEGVQGGTREEDRIFDWEKVQELRSGKYTLWDHSFELPHKHLEAEANIVDSVQVGKINHKLKVGNNDKLEIYDYPGEYAQRFDGIDRGGGERPSDLQKIFQDNRRTTDIRIQEEAVPGLVIQGASNCRQFVSGHKFTLQRHFNADGQYVLTTVSHSARQPGDYRSEGGDFHYSNSFSCIPLAVPFRPQRLTPKPVVQGTQTAVVVGPKGEEIFTDKYGRVKVQFHWDRDGKSDANSSCWVRVAQNWAGKRWGAVFLPRIGHEVVVDYLEGDPDQPIIIGSVYNASEMPPYELPDEKTKSTIKTRSSIGQGVQGFNEIRFEDKKGEEQVFLHGEKDLDVRIKNDRREHIGHDRHLIVKRDKREQIDRDEHNLVKRDRVEEIVRDHHLKITGQQAIEITGSHSLAVTGDVIEEFSMNHSEQVTMNYYLKGMQVVIEGMTGITLKVGGSFITLNPAGVQIVAPMIMLNSGGAALPGTPGTLVSPMAIVAADIAADAVGGSESLTYKNQRAQMSPEAAAAAEAPWHDPNSEEAKKKKSWIEIELVDQDGNPVPGEKYRVTLPDGTTLAEGTLDSKGFARVDNIDPGTCKVT
ncbi:MAG TPA: type VI secretion system tip protein TssI/VgrG, partial [Candidatus Binatia bacterium]|nr:type VI secretion system tip protein TssI/VgrG [Candidatus Binatia bacterium]